MTKKLCVDVADIREAQGVLARINRVQLQDIQWECDGKVIPVTPEEIEEWKFIGLNNTDCIDHIPSIRKAMEE